MPTILLMLGWRFYFYANERDEPPHVHCRKGGAEAKYWIDTDNFEVFEAHAFGMKPADKRIVRRIILEHFDYIINQWNDFQEERNE
jgi:hypothetical protein